MQHYLLSVLGSKWRNVHLAMITAFVDDSGTAPDQKVAIASALRVESKRIVALDKEVAALALDEGFSFFHTSPCVAANPKSDFADWDLEKRKRVCGLMRKIAMKYAVSAVSVAIDRDLYDEVVSGDLRKEGGKFHYTWAVGYLVELLENWAAVHHLDHVPTEYIFDCMGETKRNERKAEIEAVMQKAEDRKPGYYIGHYAFRSSKQTPGLQCTDILAWTCYQFALFKLNGILPHEIGKDGFWEFEGYRPKEVEWLLAIVQTREQLKQWVAGRLETR
jgi:hypothetical protein